MCYWMRVAAAVRSGFRLIRALLSRGGFVGVSDADVGQAVGNAHAPPGRPGGHVGVGQRVADQPVFVREVAELVK